MSDIIKSSGGGLSDPLAAVLPWLRAVDNWMKADANDPEPPPKCPVDALLTAAQAASSFALRGAPALALATELRRTREERDAARQELAAARAAIGEAWFLRPDDSVALALARKTTALERLADGGER